MIRPVRSRWQPHVNAVAPTPALRHWLTLDSSLTAALRARCRDFRVQLLNQHTGPCLPDEYAAIGLPRPQRVHIREVLLRCDDLPVVFAHTVVPRSATAADWPIFRSLGERSLGTLLFGDPQVVRGALQFTRLAPSHPLVQRICAALAAEPLKSRFQAAEMRHKDGPMQGATPQMPHRSSITAAWHARRCLFWRGRSPMLVTEIFLPGILTLTE